jgi:chromosome segregation ATPase
MTEDPITWAKIFSEAPQEQRQAMYRQSVEDIAKTRVGGVWDTVVKVVTRDNRLTANELLARLNENLLIIPDEYRKAISFVTVMKALDSFTEKERVRDDAKKVEAMARVFSVPPEVAKKLHLKQLIKNHSALTKYPNVVKAADDFIAGEKPITLDIPKMYKPTPRVKLIDTELVHAGQKLPEVVPDPLPKVPVVPENSPRVQNEQDSKPDKAKSVEEKKEEPKQEQPKEQIQPARPMASEQVNQLLSKLNLRDTFIKELQDKISDLEKQPKEFRPHLIDARGNPKESELKTQVQALKDAIAGKDSSMVQLTRERSAEKSALESQLQATTNQLQQSRKNLGEQQAQNRTLQDNVARKDHDLGIKDVDNRQLTEDLQQARQNLTDTQNQNKNLQDQVTQQNRRIQDLQQDVTTKSNTSNTLGAELNKRDADIAQLKRERATEKVNSQKDLNDQQTRNQDLQNEITQRGQMIERRDKLSGELNKENRTLKTHNRTLQAEMAQKDRDLETRDAANRQLATDLQQARQNLTDTRNQNKNLQDQVTQQNRRVQDLQQDVTTKSTTSNTLGAELNKRDADIVRLKHTHTTEKSEWDARLQVSENRLQGLQKDLTDTQNQNKNLQDQVTQQNRRIQDLQQDVTTKSNTSNTLGAELNKRDADIARLKRTHTTEKSEWENQLQATTNQLQQSQKNLGEQQAQNRTLQENVAQKDRELGARDAANRQLATDLQQSQRESASFRDQVTQQNHRIQDLQQSVNNKDKLIDTLGGQLSQRDTAIHKLTTEKDAIEARWREVNDQLRQSREDLVNMRTENQELQKEVKIRQELLDKRDASIVQFKEENGTLQAEMAQKERDLGQRTEALQQSQQELTNFQNQVRRLQGQNQDLQLEKTQLSIVGKLGRSKLLEIVRAVLSNRHYLDLLRYKVPRVPTLDIQQPLQNIQALIGPTIDKCIEIYERGIGVSIANLRHEVVNFNDLVVFNGMIHEGLTTVTNQRKLFHELFTEKMRTYNFPDKDIEVFLWRILSSPEFLNEQQQQVMRYSLELFMTQVGVYSQLVDGINVCDQKIRAFTAYIEYGAGIWEPPSETAQELGVAMLKTCQLMHFCRMPLGELGQLIRNHLKGEWTKENVLLALQKIKIKLYALIVLKLAYEVASPATGVFGGPQPPITEDQLKNMAVKLQALTDPDVTLKGAQWHEGWRNFTDPCPAREKMVISLEKAEEIFQKIYKPIMDEKCFLQMLLSQKLRDLL